jgi:hypothetical protein
MVNEYSITLLIDDLIDYNHKKNQGKYAGTIVQDDLIVLINKSRVLK